MLQVAYQLLKNHSCCMVLTYIHIHHINYHQLSLIDIMVELQSIIHHDLETWSKHEIHDGPAGHAASPPGQDQDLPKKSSIDDSLSETGRVYSES